MKEIPPQAAHVQLFNASVSLLFCVRDCIALKMSNIHTAVASGTGKHRRQHSWVTIVTRLQAGWTAVRFPAKARGFCLLQNVQTGSGVHVGTRGSYPWDKGAVAWGCPISCIYGCNYKWGVWVHTCRLNLYAPYTPSWHVKKLFYSHIYRRRHGKGANILQNFVAESRIKRLHGSTKPRLEYGLHRKGLCALKLLACCIFSPTSSYTHMCKTKKEKLFGWVLCEAW